MNLKEALARAKLKEFAKEHESKDPYPMGKRVSTRRRTLRYSACSQASGMRW
jgi:hypothetical protein